MLRLSGESLRNQRSDNSLCVYLDRLQIFQQILQPYRPAVHIRLNLGKNRPHTAISRDPCDAIIPSPWMILCTRATGKVPPSLLVIWRQVPRKNSDNSYKR